MVLANFLGLRIRVKSKVIDNKYEELGLKKQTLSSVLISTLILTIVLPMTTVAAQNQTIILYAKGGDHGKPKPAPTYTIDLLGVAWDHTPLNVLIIPEPSIAGWKDSYVADAHSAIIEWENAITIFAERYGSTYIKDLTFNVYVEGVNNVLSSYDVTIDWVYGFAPRSILGATSVSATSDGKITSVSIRLAITVVTKGGNYYLTDYDVQNVAAHEFGHALGLGHSDVKGDLMYPSTSLPQSITYPSTLDVYGLTVVYAWLNTGVFAAPTVDSATLPKGIPYTTLS